MGITVTVTLDYCLFTIFIFVALLKDYLKVSKSITNLKQLYRNVHIFFNFEIQSKTFLYNSFYIE